MQANMLTCKWSLWGRIKNAVASREKELPAPIHRDKTDPNTLFSHKKGRSRS